MGCSSSQERVELGLEELEGHARDSTMRLYSRQVERRRNGFHQCETQREDGDQCRGVVDEEVDGNPYCGPCLSLLKQDQTAYAGHISGVITYGGCDMQVYSFMIKDNIQYVLRKRQLDQEHLRKLGISDKQRFISIQLEAVGLLNVLADMIRDYLDFTPEIMAVRGRVGVTFLHGAEVYHVHSECRAFVYNHTWQRFMGIDSWNCVHFGLMKQIDPTYQGEEEKEYFLNYCALAPPKHQKGKLDLFELM